MFRTLKYIFFTLIILVALAIILPLLIPVNSYKPEIEAKVREYIDRDLKIGGNINFSLLPSLSIKIHDVKLVSLPGFAEANFIIIERAQAVLSLIELLKGNIVVKSAYLDKPVINLEISKTGEKNWEIHTKSVAKSNVDDQSVASNNDELELPFYVEDFKINDGKIKYITKESITSVKNINLSTKITSKTGPVNFDILLDTLDQQVKIEGRVNNIANIMPLEVNLFAAGQQLKFSGNFDMINTSLKGELSSHGKTGKLNLNFIPDQDYSFLANLEINKEYINITKGHIESASINLSVDIKHDLNSNKMQTYLLLEPGSVNLNLNANFGEKPLSARFDLKAVNIADLLKKLQIVQGIVNNITNQTLTLSGDITYQDQNINISNIIFALGKGKVTGNIIAKDWSQNIGVSYNLKIDDLSAIISGITGQKSELVKNLTTQGDLQKLQNSYKFNTNLTLLDNNLSINGQIDDPSKPKFILNIKADQLNLNRILGNAVEGSAKTSRATSVSSSATEKWPGDKINLEFLDNIEGQINLNIAKLVKDQLIFDTIKSQIIFGGGVAKIESFSGGLYGGILNLSGSLRGTKQQSWNLTASLKNANLHKIAPQNNRFKITSGRVNLTSDFNAKGDSIKAYIANLDGNVNLTVTDGIITGVNLQKIVDSLNNIRDIGSIIGALNSSIDKGQTNFNNCRAVLSIKNGIANIKEGTLEADRVNAAAKGNIDLPKYLLDIGTNIKVDKFPAFSIYFSGPLDNPSYKLDMQELQQYLIKNVVGSVIDDLKQGKTKPKDIIKGIIGGSRSQGNETDTSKQHEQKPEEVLKNTMKKLFK